MTFLMNVLFKKNMSQYKQNYYGHHRDRRQGHGKPGESHTQGKRRPDRGAEEGTAAHADDAGVLTLTGFTGQEQKYFLIFTKNLSYFLRQF